MIPATTDLHPLVAGSSGRIARTLAADRYLDLPDSPEDKTWRLRSCERIRNGAIATDAKLPGWNVLLDRLASTGAIVFLARLESRLLVNIAGTALENGGLSLDRISGLPTIPGSALKGCARREALALLATESDATMGAALLRDIALVFGWSPDDWSDQSDFFWAVGGCIVEGEWSEFRQGVERAIVSEGKFEQFPRAFAGCVQFLPALPAARDPGIDLDVVTNHHPDYYAGRRTVATDDEEPNPICLPTVSATARAPLPATFRFTLRPAVRSTSPLLSSAVLWLKEALANGIGAKTAAGYGRFTPEGWAADAARQTTMVALTSPCFCTGASQAEAEVRGSSVRGLWRWWFRVLGGTAEEERSVFGGIGQNGESPTASSLHVHVRIVQRAQPWAARAALGRANPQTPLGYIGYPIKEGQGGVGGAKGIRLGPDANLGPGTVLHLERRDRFALEGRAEALASLAWRCVLAFGGVGYRVTRGFGGWSRTDLTVQELQQLAATLQKHHGFAIRLRAYSDWHAALRTAERWIKLRRSKERHGGNGIRADVPNALGNALPRFRQASAVQFRVVSAAIASHQKPQIFLLAFEAPHHRVLGQDARRKTTKQILPEYELPDLSAAPHGPHRE